MQLTDPRDDLRFIRTHWADVLDLLEAPTTASTWPPLQLSHHLAEAAAADRADLDRVERAERSALAPGERTTPLNVAAFDEARAIELLLQDAADGVVHHEPADMRPAERWSPVTSWRHGTPWACLYLEGAVAWLPPVPREHVSEAASEARRRTEKALGLAGRTDPIAGRSCPRCGAEELVLRHGGERLPEVACRTCPARWVGGAMEVLIRADAA